jgi:regulator of replication initiation timing
MSEETKTPAIDPLNQTINNAVSALMDVANMLREIPKLVAANKELATEVERLRKELESKQ